MSGDLSEQTGSQKEIESLDPKTDSFLRTTETADDKSKSDGSLFWKNGGSVRHGGRFGFGASFTVDTVFTWTVLIIVSIISGIAGGSIILFLPKPEKTVYSTQVKQEINPAPVLNRFFKIAEKPLACSIGPERSFFVMTKGAVLQYDVEGKKQRSWKIDLPDEEFKPNSCALCYSRSSEVAQPNIPVTQAVYIACGSRIFILNPDQEEAPVQFLTLDNGTKISSMLVIKTDLFLADSSKKLIYCFNLANLTEKFVIGAPSEETGFPGFCQVHGTSLCLASFRDENYLYASNPALFRIEVFDKKTGQWHKELSWGRHPGQEYGFGGVNNPSQIAAMRSGRILTAESGKIVPLKMFSKTGDFICSFVAFEQKNKSSVPLYPKVLVLDNGTIVVFSEDGDVELY